ncbi:MAG: flagellar motor switch protein FliN [Bacteroidota bacterium]
MNYYQEQLQRYSSTIEEFLTSILLEKTVMTITSFDTHSTEETLARLKERDIVLHIRDEEYQMDVIAILDEEWFGLLSSIMLGVEEKTFNDTTKDLLKKFATDLSKTVKERLQEDGFTPNFGKVKVLKVKELTEILAHTEYFVSDLEIEGLADENVRAALLMGNPEALVQQEEEYDLDESSMFDTPEAEENKGEPMEVISGSAVQFDEFDENMPALQEIAGKNMDLLRDVDMDVSVELGRIELPLGKVLQLSKGSVIELDKLAGEPVDILVNGQRIAHGEVVVIDEHFGVRISNLITTKQRLATLS